MDLKQESSRIKIQQASELQRFLALEGLSLKESNKLLDKMEKIYEEIVGLNHSYTISEISKMVIDLFDDTFFDEYFVMSLLEEALCEHVEWGNLYPTIKPWEQNSPIA